MAASSRYDSTGQSCVRIAHQTILVVSGSRSELGSSYVVKGGPRPPKPFGTKGEAKVWATMLEADMARNVFVNRSAAEHTTLKDLLIEYESKVTCHKKSAASERIRIAALTRDRIAFFAAANLTSQIFSEWRDARLKCVSGSTVNRELNLLSHVINVARKEWGIHIDNPIAMIRRPKENRARSWRLSPAEEDALLAAMTPGPRDAQGRFMPGTCRNEWLAPIVIVAVETGMRRSELLSLTWEDVKLEDRFARLSDSKSGESRDVPLYGRVRRRPSQHFQESRRGYSLSPRKRSKKHLLAPGSSTAFS